MNFTVLIRSIICVITLVGIWQIIHGPTDWILIYGVSVVGFDKGEYYRLVVGPLGHLSLLHFWCNTISLYYIAEMFNEESVRFKFYVVFIFFSSLFFSAVIYSIFGGVKNSVGISGGLFGLVGLSLIVLEGEFKKRLYKVLFFTALVGLLFPGHIDNLSHLSGLVLGVLFGWCFFSKYPKINHDEMIS